MQTKTSKWMEPRGSGDLDCGESFDGNVSDDEDSFQVEIVSYEIQTYGRNTASDMDNGDSSLEEENVAVAKVGCLGSPVVEEMDCDGNVDYSDENESVVIYSGCAERPVVEEDVDYDEEKEGVVFYSGCAEGHVGVEATDDSDDEEERVIYENDYDNNSKTDDDEVEVSEVSDVVMLELTDEDSILPKMTNERKSLKPVTKTSKEIRVQFNTIVLLNYMLQ